MNAVRVPLIRRTLARIPRLLSPSNFENNLLPFKGLSILDVGSGGGILCEPLARLGANMLGVDASDENVQVATYHASLDPGLEGKIQYKKILVEDLAEQKITFDAVVCSEVLEHVSNREKFTHALCSMVKPGGYLIMTTINRTLKSFSLGIVAAEYVLGIVPPGTHEWQKCITPTELIGLVQSYRENLNSGSNLESESMGVPLFEVEQCVGFAYNPLLRRWSVTSDTDINYGLVFRRLE